MTIYFAYGSNLDHDQIRKRCPSANGLAIAKLSDYRLAFTGKSSLWGGAVATIEPEPGATTWGALYALSTADCAELDRWEGAPHAYERIDVRVVVPTTGASVQAVTYRKRDRKPGKPTPAYLERIERGYRAWGLPLDALEAVQPRAQATNLVAVYGSLLEGLGNHRVLARWGAELVGSGQTVERLEMADFGSYPGLRRQTPRHDDALAAQIAVEVYAVTTGGLHALDALEGHPTFYRRQPIDVRLSDGTVIAPACYLITNDRTWAQMARRPVPSGNWRHHLRRRNDRRYGPRTA